MSCEPRATSWGISKAATAAEVVLEVAGGSLAAEKRIEQEPCLKRVRTAAKEARQGWAYIGLPTKLLVQV